MKKKIKVNAADETGIADNPIDNTAAAEPVETAVNADEQLAEDTTPLAAQLEQAETRANDYLDSLQRERAAFQNYKRRVERERSEQAQTITANLLTRLLPVIDDFQRAMDAVPEGERDQWFEGVSLIQRKLDQMLTNEGVTVMDALGQPFDPAYHEAIGVDSETDAESGTVTQVLQRGYIHKDRVLRPAMVRVAE